MSQTIALLVDKDELEALLDALNHKRKAIKEALGVWHGRRARGRPLTKEDLEEEASLDAELVAVKKLHDRLRGIEKDMP